ncbi:MAG: hypothetical protein ACRENB_09420 [Gemmatimonadales bacterium]
MNLDAGASHVIELEERVDFTERLLAQQRGVAELPRGGLDRP